MAGGRKLAENFIHLGLGASAVPQPPFDGLAWYEGYGARHGDDGPEGRLVSMYTFDSDWDSWEVHPKGAEIVLCTQGTMTLIQDFPDGHRERVTIEAGEYAVNPPGVWHTADIAAEATAVFITAGEGTEHRSRSEFPADE